MLKNSTFKTNFVTSGEEINFAADEDSVIQKSELDIKSENTTPSTAVELKEIPCMVYKDQGLKTSLDNVGTWNFRDADGQWMNAKQKKWAERKEFLAQPYVDDDGVQHNTSKLLRTNDVTAMRTDTKEVIGYDKEGHPIVKHTIKPATKRFVGILDKYSRGIQNIDGRMKKEQKRFEKLGPQAYEAEQRMKEIENGRDPDEAGKNLKEAFSNLGSFPHKGFGGSEQLRGDFERMNRYRDRRDSYHDRNRDYDRRDRQGSSRYNDRYDRDRGDRYSSSRRRSRSRSPRHSRRY